MDFYEQQAFAMRNVPGLGIDDGRFIDHWVERARADDRHHVTTWVKQRRDKNREKVKEVTDRINKVQDEFVAIRKKAERNEVPWSDLAKAQRRMATARMTLEKVYESLTSSEASNERMEDDPSAYLVEFYSRFPTLQDRRPNLAYALDEDRKKRGAHLL